MLFILFTESERKNADKEREQNNRVNKTENVKVPSNSSTVTDQPKNGHNLEMYLVPSLMSCPLFLSLYIIYKLYMKVRRMNEANALNTPILRLSAFETDL